VRGFSAHFGLRRVSSVCVLPLHHVSGFMAWMRSALTGGAFVPWSWKDLESGRFPGSMPDDACLSLVPTQLQRLLGSSAALEWLRRFRIIFVGGGPARADLLDKAARLRLPVSTGYGSTETAAMAAALLPERFLAGERGCGKAMPHAKIDLVGGIVRVSGESIFRGYHPGHDGSATWLSGDEGTLDGEGRLQIIGRSDDVIVTGGKKVGASEVEAALGASGLFEDVAVVGVPDPEWGELVVACHPPGRSPSRSEVSAALGSIASYKHPKRLVEISPWPRNAQGKMNRAELRRLAAALA
jgi:O-succinylbenzoic acid--CoA ligase